MSFAFTKIIKILAGVMGVALILSVSYVGARAVTSYSNDKTNYQFVSDIKTSYTAEESKDISISFIDINTGTKPAGVSVLMQVDGGPTQTVLSASSRTSSRFVNLGSLSQGPHEITFTLPEACGNFFDFSNFDSVTKFDNQFDCQFVRQFMVGSAPVIVVPPTEEACIDPNANNTGGVAPCTYDPGVQACLHDLANNTGSPLPCTYNADRCFHTLANNTGALLPCTYNADRCFDSFANNTGALLPCTYGLIQGCTNSLATNYDPNATDNDGSCVFPPEVLNGCTDPSASNYIPTAQNDNGSCEYYVYGCTDYRADNYNAAATASDASCVYPGEVTPSDFECSVNTRNWTACEGRTFTLTGPNDNIYVRTEPQNAGVWSDWCTGDLNNGVQATFNGTTSNDDNAEVSFTFANPGSLFDMTLCLNPATSTKAQSFQRIKLKLLDTRFNEN